MAKSRKEVEAIVSAMGVFMAIISDLVELVKKFGGTMENIYRLATPEGSENLEAIARIIVSGTEKIRDSFLHLVSGGERLILDAVDGLETLYEAKDIFAYMSYNLMVWGLNEKGKATEETRVAVYEMAKDATFSQMFGELSSDMRNLCLTQAQIINFVRKHYGWLRKNGYATLFLFESRGEFFVARVNINSDKKPVVGVSQLEAPDVLAAKNRHRVVVPSGY